MIAGDGDAGREASPTDESVSARTARAHATVHRLLQKLSDAREPERIREVLETANEFLPEHFSEEEAVGGLFEEIQALRPGTAARLKSLRQEHRNILQALDTLLEEIRGLEQLATRIATRRDDFVKMIRSHEGAEVSLVMDTHYVDEGGSG